MIDPIPPCPSWLSSAVKPYSDYVSAATLPLHAHEVLGAALFYESIRQVFSPVFSSYVFPRIYPDLNARTRLNWDVHVVSMVQSCLINTLALWVMFADEERKEMTAVERVYGYTGAGGMIQGLAAGYFLWDLIVCTRHIKVFGPGLWAHGLAALVVFSFGFVRPQVSCSRGKVAPATGRGIID